MTLAAKTSAADRRRIPCRLIGDVPLLLYRGIIVVGRLPCDKV